MKKIIAIVLMSALIIGLCSCGTKSSTGAPSGTAETDVMEISSDSSDTADNEAIAEAIKEEQDSKAAEDAEAAEETAGADAEPVKEEEKKEEKEPVKASVDVNLPLEYTLTYMGEGGGGTVEFIEYHANDYVGDGEGYEKKAYVYLPAGYDPEGHYNVIYLMHGIGGSEKEWGLNDKSGKLKKILDNLIGRGDIEPLIVVTPNGKALACESDPTASFYLFGYELRNDLIPYIESHYATYAEYNEDGYDLTAARDHRAMAGLSMGGMQTINIGICECLDIISWFGAFSAAPTSYEVTKVAAAIDNSDYTLNYFYNICGTSDNIAYASASAAAKTLPVFSEKIVDGENYMWMEKIGGHDFSIWNLGLYNFAQLAFKDIQ